MNQVIKYLLVLFVLGSIQVFFTSCLWDSDTIEMEREQFPSVLELISGNFLRHSPAFYYWRVKDRTAKLKENPNHLDWYDDLAVAYSKLGEQKKALQIMKKKELLEGVVSYKTYANLGTFHIFDGNLAAALESIDKALAIDGNAHFGREIYQKYLVEYILSKSNKGKITLPLDTIFYGYPQTYYSKLSTSNFYSFLLKKHNRGTGKEAKELPKEALEKALVGVMGMMRFANYDSPILLEVLGDLLFNTGNRSAARHLASRAYLKASYEVTDSKNQEVYRKRAAYLLHTQYANEAKKFLGLKQLKILLDKEIQRGELFYQAIKKDELFWISEGKEVEEAFLKKYYNAPVLPKLTFAGISREKIVGMRKYLRDSFPIGAQLDYRPILAHKVNLDLREQTFIDSLFERRLELELVAEVQNIKQNINIKQDENTIELSNSDTSWGGIGIVFILVILGAVFFFFKK